MALTEQQKQQAISELTSGANAPMQDNAMTVTPERVSAMRQSVIQPQSSFFGVGEAIRGIGTGIKDAFTRRTQNVADIKSVSPDPITQTRQTLGQSAGLASDIIGEVFIGGLKAITPQAIEKPITSGISSRAQSFVQSEPVQNFIQSYEALPQEIKNEISATLGAGSLALDVAGAGLISKGSKAVAPTVKQVGGKALNVAGAGLISKGSKAVAPTFEKTKQIGRNIGTNIEEGRAFESAIKQLPSDTARSAVRGGVELHDVQKLVRLPASQKAPLGKLYDITKRFSEGKTKTNPIEAVGQPIVKRLNTLKSQVSTIGKKLDTTAQGLRFRQVKNIQELGNAVEETLRKLDVSIGKGKLNLKGSRIEGLGGNEKIIQQVYKRFLDSKDAWDLHRLKKYIDDNVAYGKTSQGLTGTSESLLKSWRKMIDDTLDNQFPTYKTLNAEYAQRIKPINDLQKIMKSVAGADEDILSMSAGLLARRIASNAVSNPQIRQILRNLDKATKVKGKTTLNVENLVDFYSTLEKYFPEIVGKNTFKGQIKSGIESVGGIQEMAIKKVKALAGNTEAVRRKAIIDLLDSIFN